MKSRNRIQDMALTIMLCSFWLMFLNRAFWMVMVFGGFLYIVSLFFPRHENNELKIGEIFNFKNLEKRRKLAAIFMLSSIPVLAIVAYYNPSVVGWYGLYSGIIIVLLFVLQESNPKNTNEPRSCDKELEIK